MKGLIGRVLQSEAYDALLDAKERGSEFIQVIFHTACFEGGHAVGDHDEAIGGQDCLSLIKHIQMFTKLFVKYGIGYVAYLTEEGGGRTTGGERRGGTRRGGETGRKRRGEDI